MAVYLFQMEPEKAAKLHEAERLISQLENRVRSAKVRAATALQNIDIYPDLISETGQFLQQVMTPVLMKLSDDTEKVRELSVALISKYVHVLPKGNLIDTLTYVLPPLYARLKEDVEPAEHVKYALMELLLTLINFCGPDSYPSCWDQFVPPMEPIMKAAFKSSDAEMKKIACKVLDAAIEKTQPGVFHPFGQPLAKAILPNCGHRHNEVRRQSLLTLARILVKSQNNDDIDKVHEVVQKLVFDKNSSVRKAVIEFLRIMLVEHPMRHVMYHPLMLSLFYFIGPIVPLRPIYCGIPVKEAKINSEEAELAWNVAVEIGRQHEEDKFDDFRKELQYFEEERFDETRSIPRGLTHIVQDLFPKWIDRLLPMLSDWTENTRKYSYLSMRAILHCAMAYSTRHVPQILRGIGISLRDFPKEADDSLQVAAVLASNVPACDIITVLLPQLTNDGPPNMLLLLSATTLNDNPNDGELGTILDGLQEAGTYETLVAIDSLVQLILSMIKRSKEFADVNSVNLLNMIIRLCEHSDAMKLFQDAFGRPISQVIAENLQMLLMGSQVTPLFLRTLLDPAPVEAIRSCQRWVCLSTAKVFTKGVAEISKLVEDLARRGSFTQLGVDYMEKVIASGKENISMIKALIEMDALDQSLYDARCDLLMNAILEEMKQQNDDERLIAIETMQLFEGRAKLPAADFEKIFKGLMEGIKDHMDTIRIKASEVMGSYLPKCEEIESVPEKFQEIVVSIDDENEEIRKAISVLCKAIGSVEKWKPKLIETIKSQTNYHTEATQDCENLLNDLQ